jgi:WD40 repeat protein
MKRWITRFAFAGKCGAFGASGIAVSSDGAVLAVLEDPNALVFWNTKTGRELLRLGDGRKSDDDDIFSVAFSSDGKTLAMGARKGLQLWEMIYGKP